MKSITIKVDQAEMMAAVLEKLLPCMQWDKEFEMFYVNQNFMVSMSEGEKQQFESLKERIESRLKIAETL